MPSGLARGLLLGFITACCGVIFYLIPPFANLETDLGLKLLFQLRGARTPPAHVVVVSIDRQSSRHFGYPNQPRKWPRSLHGELINKLNEYGARVIVFDVIFTEERETEQDQTFAHALADAGNVILFAYLTREPALVPDAQGEVREILMERLIPPHLQFAKTAVAYAPFPLPKVPARVNQAWLFKTNAGDLPTMPVVALHYFAAPVYAQLQRLLQSGDANSAELSQLFEKFDQKGSDISQSMRVLRQLIRQHPQLESTSATRPRPNPLIDYTHTEVLLKALLAMYQGSDSRYINFYGPPQSITTLPYYQIIDPGTAETAEKMIPDLRDKVVFVGFSEQFQTEQKDSFYTVFSQPTGIDVSGVEIAATVFANLLENRSIQPVARPYDLALIFGWGLIAGVLFYLLPAIGSVLASIILSFIYLAIADYYFTSMALWLPVIQPLFFQLPLTLLAALLWRYLATRKQQQKIYQATSYFLPRVVVDALPKWNQKQLVESSRVVQGVCMMTDAERYTPLSESMQPEPLRQLLNRYYELLFVPIKNHRGSVMDVVGDAALAIWTDDPSFVAMRNHACQAALEIQQRIEQAEKHQHSDSALPTRIGLHCGEMIIGNVGAGNHYEYRAVGDNINTVSRIEGLNKYLGTRILASAQVIAGLNNLVTRRLGKFRLKGKENWLEIYELVCAFERASDLTLELNALFADALLHFETECWQQAKWMFELALQRQHSDGPSQFYLNYCERYLRDGSPQHWDGIISLAEK